MLGIGAVILDHLKHPRTVSRAWEALRAHPDVISYPRFLAALDLLYTLGVVDLEDGLLRKTGP